jgi:hypothetical protein
MAKKVLTQEDLDKYPKLVEEGFQVGDEAEVPETEENEEEEVEEIPGTEEEKTEGSQGERDGGFLGGHPTHP